MLDPKLLRDDIAALEKSLAGRGEGIDFAKVRELALAHRELQTQAQELAEQSNRASSEIGELMRAGNKEEAQQAKAKARELSDKLQDMRAETAQALEAFEELASCIPNIPAPDTPPGQNEQDNIELARFGCDGALRESTTSHWDYLLQAGYADDKAAATMAGARFSVLAGPAARLHRAVGQCMLDAQIARGYCEVIPPFVVQPQAPYGAGQFPKFADDAFQTTDGRVLISTGEVPLVNLLAGRTLKADALPWKVVALTPCFRREAGSYGRDTQGLIRQHQFEKVELVAACDPAHSEDVFRTMLADAAHVLELLELPYRQVQLCAGDMGFAACRTLDLEVWMPSQKTFREISSVSWCGDFQARRLGARCKGEGGTSLLHTFNASGVAVSRAVPALIENHTDTEGNMRVPEALRSYLGGEETISFARRDVLAHWGV